MIFSRTEKTLFHLSLLSAQRNSTTRTRNLGGFFSVSVSLVLSPPFQEQPPPLFLDKHKPVRKATTHSQARQEQSTHPTPFSAAAKNRKEKKKKKIIGGRNRATHYKVFGLEEGIGEMGAQKISVSDHTNGLQYAAGGDNSDNFVINMDTFTAKDVPANPRISRNLSRKWSHRGGEEKVIPNGNSNSTEKSEKDSSLPSASPRASNGPERLAAGTTENGNSPQVHHQITITAANIGTSGESRCVRRNSFRRASMSPSWMLDPKRILFIFATLSSIGTIMLIYFTLSIGKPSNATDGAGLDLQQ